MSPNKVTQPGTPSGTKRCRADGSSLCRVQDGRESGKPWQESVSVTREPFPCPRPLEQTQASGPGTQDTAWCGMEGKSNPLESPWDNYLLFIVISIFINYSYDP